MNISIPWLSHGYLMAILWILGSTALANEQGSLNNYHGENSVANSNNTTTDTSSTTENTYNGAGAASEIPVGSAISPTFMSNGSDTCLKGTAGSVQTVAIGFSSGGYTLDVDCTRLKYARMLSALQLKVAAVSMLCQSTEVFKSMLLAGSPCPFISNGRLVAGKRGLMLIKQKPELYIPDYKENRKYYDGILQIGEVSEDVEEDSMSISDKFRSTKQ
ncbi:hypothetical protein N8909_00495 [bacterium]|nr:hypothetical protein [bacterium]MDA7760501.1 hypothetical protein [bacterium]